MSVLALIVIATVVAFVVLLVLGLALAAVAARADAALELMERPVFIGSGFLDVGPVFEWPEQDQ